MQSSPTTVDSAMVRVLRWNFVAFFVLLIVFVWARYAIALARREREVAPPPLLLEAAR